ncbi:MAG TPA: hypothetical protein DCS12_09840 [Clostridiales bacterium]|nr:hypothetical protein [Clostridiales bacterium]
MAVEVTTDWQEATYNAQLRTVSSSQSTNQNDTYAYTSAVNPEQWYLRHKNTSSFDIPTGSTVTKIRIRAYAYSSVDNSEMCAYYSLNNTLPFNAIPCVNAVTLGTSGAWKEFIFDVSETDLSPFNTSNMINTRLFSVISESGEVNYIDSVQIAITYEDGTEPTPTPTDSPSSSPTPSPSPVASASGTITFASDDPFVVGLSDYFRITFLAFAIIVFLLSFIAVANVYKR